MTRTRPSNVDPTIVCPRCPTVLPYTPYTPPKPQWGSVLKPALKFTNNGRQGIPLGMNIAETIQHLDCANEPVFSDCGPKFMLIIQLNGYRPFKIQKHAWHTHPKGKRAPNSRAKVVTQIMEGMAAFIARGVPDLTNPTDHFVLGEGGIKLEDLVLLELHHVAKSSFQPVFGLKCKCLPAPVAAPEHLLEAWLTDMSQWGTGSFYDNTNLSNISVYAPTNALAADDQLAQWALDFMSMDGTSGP